MSSAGWAWIHGRVLYIARSLICLWFWESGSLNSNVGTIKLISVAVATKHYAMSFFKIDWYAYTYPYTYSETHTLLSLTYPRIYSLTYALHRLTRSIAYLLIHPLFTIANRLGKILWPSKRRKQRAKAASATAAAAAAARVVAWSRQCHNSLRHRQPSQGRKRYEAMFRKGAIGYTLEKQMQSIRRLGSYGHTVV